MPALTGPFVVALVLLAVAGGFKVWQPEPTTGALQAAGWPASDALARMLGLVELGLAAAAILIGGPVFALGAAVLYAGFAAFVVVALRRGLALQSCGCFGKVDTPPSWAHAVVNLGAAVVCATTAILAPEPVAALLLDLSALPLLVGVGVASYLMYVLLTIMPTVSTRARP